MPLDLPQQWFVLVEALQAKGWRDEAGDVPTDWWSLYQQSFVRQGQRIVLSLLTEPYGDGPPWAVGASREFPENRQAAAQLGTLVLGRRWRDHLGAFLRAFDS